MNGLAMIESNKKYKKNMVLSNRIKNYVNAPSRHGLFDSAGAGGGGTSVVVVAVVVGEGWRVVVLAARLGAIRVKPCSNPDPLVKNLDELPHVAILLLSIKTQKNHSPSQNF